MKRRGMHAWLAVALGAAAASCTVRAAGVDASAAVDAPDAGVPSDAGRGCRREDFACEVQDECWTAAGTFCDRDGVELCGPLSVYPQGWPCAAGAGVCYTGAWLPGHYAGLDGAVSQWAFCRLTNQRSCRGPVIDAFSCGFTGCDHGTLCGASIGGDDTFDLGSEDAANAAPIVRGVRVGALEMDAMEVSVARFRAFWLATDREPGARIPYPDRREIVWRGELREPIHRATPDDVHNWSPVAGVQSREGHPINGVDWWTALAFCVWDGGRLPTEAEWEYFARIREAEGDEVLRRGRTYAWGEGRGIDETGDCRRGIYGGCRFSSAEPWPHSESVYAMRSSDPAHMSGNVAEWTADAFRAYDDPCWSDEPRGAWCPADPEDVDGVRTVRGGSYLSPELMVRGASREGVSALVQSAEIGFRCVRERP